MYYSFYFKNIHVCILKRFCKDSILNCLNYLWKCALKRTLTFLKSLITSFLSKDQNHSTGSQYLWKNLNPKINKTFFYNIQFFQKTIFALVKFSISLFFHQFAILIVFVLKMKKSQIRKMFERSIDKTFDFLRNWNTQSRQKLYFLNLTINQLSCCNSYNMDEFFSFRKFFYIFLA